MSNKKPEKGLDPKVLADAQANASKFAKLQQRALLDSAKVLKDIEDRQVKIADLENQIAEATGNSKKALQAKLAGQKQYLSISQQTLKQQQTYVELTRELNDITKDIQSKYDNILDTTFDQQSASKKLTDLVKRRIQAVKENNKEEIALLSTAIEQQLAYKAQIPYLQKVHGTFNQINSIAQDLASSVTSAFDSLPGGKYLSKMLGFDKLGDSFKTSINAAAKEFIATGGNIGKTMKAFGGSMKMLLNPVTLTAAALAGLFLVLKNITEQAKEFAKETGLTVAASQQLVEQSYELQKTANNRLSSQKDILAVQQQTISQLGTIGKLSGDIALRVSETGKAFGYGAQEAANVQSQMMLISGMSETAAIEAQEFTAQLALAEGVAPGAVMKDIAKSAAVSAKYFAGNPKALGKAAIEAAKLGLSLDQMAKTSEALLNIEQSLEDQFVASAMLGRQLNFDAARRLAAEGDIAGATKEVLNTLGGIEEFENASIFAKQRMAAAAGMTVEELSKSLVLQDKLAGLSDDQLAAYSGLKLSAAEIRKKSPEQLKTLLAQQQATEELAASFEKVKNSLMSAILPIAKALLPVFQGIAWTVEKFGGLLTGIVAGLATYYTTVKAIALVESVRQGIAAAQVALAGRYATLQKIQQRNAQANLATESATAIAKSTGAIASSFGAMIPVILAGAAAIAGMVYSFMDDGAVGPVGPSGYSRVLSTPEGSIAINDKDTMITGTNLSGGGGTAIDYDKLGTAVAKAIQNLKIIIDESAVGAINKRGAVAASYNG